MGNKIAAVLVLTAMSAAVSARADDWSQTNQVSAILEKTKLTQSQAAANVSASSARRSDGPLTLLMHTHDYHSQAAEQELTDSCSHYGGVPFGSILSAAWVNDDGTDKDFHFFQMCRFGGLDPKAVYRIVQGSEKDSVLATQDEINRKASQAATTECAQLGSPNKPARLVAPATIVKVYASELGLAWVAYEAVGLCRIEK